MVDGILNNSSDSTFIRLSRTRKLDSNLINSGEKNAQITVEDNSGNTLYNFAELNNNDGIYTIPGMQLTYGNRYRLHIITTTGKQYLSDEIPVQLSPLIDSINWHKDETGLTIYANTHDPLNSTKYYRWDYTETWQYHAAYYSLYKYEEYGVLVKRIPEDAIYECWKTQDSKTMLLASSDKLAEDIIYEKPLRFISANSIELQIKYSINVRQYTLPKDAYEYFQNLTRNTELRGSIFDAQPMELAGNIHSVNDPAEPVLGFVTACTMYSKRIFIMNEEVTPWFYVYQCGKFKAPAFPPDAVAYIFGQNGGNIPIDFSHSNALPDSMLATSNECGDCRAQGGVLKKPGFWQ